jgi:hypothetical protein
LHSLADLPRSLQSLSISNSGPELDDLIGLPLRLKELSLTNTHIRALKNLPSTLQTLSLIENAALEVDELPPNLLSLTVRGNTRMSGFDRLSWLNHLDAPSASLLLPPLLRRLRVGHLGYSAELTLSLTTLEIVGDNLKIFLTLPNELEEITWPGGADLADLPPNLKHLAIPYSPLVALSGLPAGVTSLDISDTKIGLDTLPPGLQHLRYQFYPSDRVSALPSALRSLDLSGSRTLKAIDTALPRSLELLNVSETSLTDLPELPPSLRVLNISRTPIKTLEKLKEGLVSLTVHAGQLESLAGLPQSVTELYFVE